MPLEASRPWAYLGLGVAALFAVGSVVAVSVATEQRRVEAVGAGDSSAALQQRYSEAALAIAQWEVEQHEAQCALDARIVTAVALEQRTEESLERGAVVQDAYILIDRVNRVAFEEDRVAAIEVFAAGFTTEEDLAVAAEYAGVEDPLASCLATSPPAGTPAAGAVTAESVEELESRAAVLSDPEATDTARFDQLDQAVTGLGVSVLRTADARVSVGRLAATGDALGAAAEQLRTTAAPAETLLTLDALIAHAEAALALQAELEAQEAQEAQRAQDEAEVEQAPAPAPQPAPEPEPEPEPAPAPEPEPTSPGNGGGNGGDSPVDPLVP